METVLTFAGFLGAFLFSIYYYLYTRDTREPEPIMEQKEEPVEPVDPKNAMPTGLLPWVFGKSLTHENWKNVRIIADQEGLPYWMKEELCATIWGESEFNTAARLDNKDKSGRVWSTDWGICQFNSYWWGDRITPEDAVNDPEKAVRLMCKAFLAGQADQWVAHKSGAYKKYLGRKL